MSSSVKQNSKEENLNQSSSSSSSTSVLKPKKKAVKNGGQQSKKTVRKASGGSRVLRSQPSSRPLLPFRSDGTKNRVRVKFPKRKAPGTQAIAIRAGSYELPEPVKEIQHRVREAARKKDGLKELEELEKELEVIMKSLNVYATLCGYDEQRRSPLHLAASLGIAENVRFLLESSERLDDVNPSDIYGITPLLDASRNGHEEVVQLLSDALSSRCAMKPWCSENDEARLVLIHDLYRQGSPLVSSTLYGESSSSSSRKQNYYRFLDTLRRSFRMEAFTVTDVVLAHSSTPQFRDFVLERLSVVSEPGSELLTTEELTAFKEGIISGMTMSQLAHIVTHDVELLVKKSPNGPIATKKISATPDFDILSSRLLICTPTGFVISSRTGKTSHAVIRFALEAMGFECVLEIPEPLQLDGADYIPAGNELCFVGTGEFTHEGTGRLLIRGGRKVLGTSYVVLVRDLFDHSEQNCRLDELFKVVSDKCIVVDNRLLDSSSTFRRLCSLYAWNKETDSYDLKLADVPFPSMVCDVLK